MICRPQPWPEGVPWRHDRCSNDVLQSWTSRSLNGSRGRTRSPQRSAGKSRPRTVVRPHRHRIAEIEVRQFVREVPYRPELRPRRVAEPRRLLGPQVRGERAPTLGVVVRIARPQQGTGRVVVPDDERLGEICGPSGAERLREALAAPCRVTAVHLARRGLDAALLRFSSAQNASAASRTPARTDLGTRCPTICRKPVSRHATSNARATRRRAVSSPEHQPSRSITGTKLTFGR